MDKFKELQEGEYLLLLEGREYCLTLEKDQLFLFERHPITKQYYLVLEGKIEHIQKLISPLVEVVTNYLKLHANAIQGRTTKN